MRGFGFVKVYFQFEFAVFHVILSMQSGNIFMFLVILSEVEESSVAKKTTNKICA